MQDGDFHFIFPYLNNKQMIFLFLILFLFFLFCFSFSLYMENYKVQFQIKYIYNLKFNDRFLSDDFFLFYGRNVISSVLNIYIYICRISYVMQHVTHSQIQRIVYYIYTYIYVYLYVYILQTIREFYRSY